MFFNDRLDKKAPAWYLLPVKNFPGRVSMEKSVYFDHAAASIPLPEVLNFQAGIPLRYYANAEAVHLLAYDCREALKRAAKELSQLFLDRNDCPVIWGDSATGLFRLLASLPDFSRSAATTLEHPALLTNLQNHSSFSTIPVSPGALPQPEKLSARPILGAIHQVQSELGSMPDCQTFFNRLDPECRLVDAVQAAGKMPLFKAADLWVVSGVKFGAPGGAALLLNPNGKFTEKLLAHAETLRHRDYALSRINVPAILTMVFAASLAVENHEKNAGITTQINSLIREECAGLGIVPTLPPETPVSKYILNLLLPSQESAVVVRALSARNIFAASGSACSAESGRPSAALTALGFPAAKAYRTLRLSFGNGNSVKDAEIFLSELKNVLKNY